MIFLAKMDLFFAEKGGCSLQERSKKKEKASLFCAFSRSNESYFSGCFFLFQASEREAKRNRQERGAGFSFVAHPAQQSGEIQEGDFQKRERRARYTKQFLHFSCPVLFVFLRTEEGESEWGK
ncbi:MAG: hypothetical protein K9M51_03625 [Candidatus Gracilibacteria bacterium]|nr:hypothetical protein [Candidatus Gracilibacteria bacterium]